MAGAFVQDWTNEADSPATSLNTTVSGATANNLLVAIVSMRSVETGLAATGWTKREGNNEDTGDAGGGYFDRIATGDSSDNFNLSWDGNSRISVTVAEYSGLDSTAPFEDSAVDLSNVATFVTSQGTGTATPTSSNGLAIAALGHYDTWDASATVSVDSSFTIDANEAGVGTRPGTYIASKTYTSTAGQSATWSTTHGTGERAFGVMAVYKEAGDGSTPRTITSSFGALIQKQGLIASASAGAMLQKQQAASASLDAAIQKAQALTASMGAALQGGVTNTADADALLQKAVTVTASLDAALMANITAGTDADAMLQKAVQVSASLDAILLQLGAISASADAMLQKPVTATASMDSALQKPLLETASLGALLQAGVTGAADLDALLQKRVTLTASMDAVLTAIGSSIRTAQIDALLRREGVTITATIGAVLQKARSLSASVDAVLAKAYTVTFGAGSLLQRGVSAAAAMSAYLISEGGNDFIEGKLVTLAGRGVNVTLEARPGSVILSERPTTVKIH